jgi:hypothetical protein
MNGYAMRWIALLTALAMAGVGCAHTQQPERRIYVISEHARGVGTSLGTGGAGDRDCQAEHENNKEAVALGTIVIIAGVAFVITTGGSGALILAPLALQVGESMGYNSNFDIDSILQILGTVNEKYQDGAPEDEALRIAAVALLFVRDIHKLDEYREYFRRFYIPAIESVVVSQAFSTREEADAWLAGGKASESELVRIAGQGFRVITARKGKGLMFLRTPLPEEMG